MAKDTALSRQRPGFKSRTEHVSILWFSWDCFLTIHVQLILNKSEINKDMKIDPYKHKEAYLKWKKEVKNRIPDLSEKNSNLLLRYLEDMECGLNVSITNKKGSRSFPRMNTLRQRLKFMFKEFEERYCNKKIQRIGMECRKNKIIFLMLLLFT